MDTFIVVEVDIVINNVLGFFKGGCRELAESFFFEMGEEGFHRCIVPTVASPRHGRRNRILFGEEGITMGGILVTLVRVQKQPL